MKYLKPKFSVPMPGASVDWPLGIPSDSPAPRRTCPVCGEFAPEGETHFWAGELFRTRRRICFGLKDA